MMVVPGQEVVPIRPFVWAKMLEADECGVLKDTVVVRKLVAGNVRREDRPDLNRGYAARGYQALATLPPVPTDERLLRTVDRFSGVWPSLEALAFRGRVLREELLPVDSTDRY